LAFSRSKTLNDDALSLLGSCLQNKIWAVLLPENVWIVLGMSCTRHGAVLRKLHFGVSNMTLQHSSEHSFELWMIVIGSKNIIHVTGHEIVKELVISSPIVLLMRYYINDNAIKKIVLGSERKEGNNIFSSNKIKNCNDTAWR